MNFLASRKNQELINTCLALPFIIQILADGTVFNLLSMADDKKTSL